jgi:hypothetical protein
VDELTVRVVGAGGTIYECFVCDGSIRRKVEVVGTCINTAAECYLETTGENLLFFGGDCPQLSYFDIEAKNLQVNKVEAYGEITRICVSPDQKNIIAATSNGIILSYSIFPIKQYKEEDN